MADLRGSHKTSLFLLTRQVWREGEEGGWLTELLAVELPCALTLALSRAHRLSHNTTFPCPSCNSHGLVKKPGFLCAGALVGLHGSELGDEEQSAEVPLVGQSGERRHLRAPQLPTNTSQRLGFALRKSMGCLPQTPPAAAQNLVLILRCLNDYQIKGKTHIEKGILEAPPAPASTP